MTRFSANLVFLWNEVPFMERFERAAAAGFDAVEYMFPLEHALGDLRASLDRWGLRQDLFNLPAGDFAAGERGIAVAPDRREEFREGAARSLEAAGILGCGKINCLVGLRDEGHPFEAQYETLVENLRWAAALLGGEGVGLQIELLNPIETPGFFLDSMPVVRSVLDDVGSPHLSFQLDVYHLHRTHGDATPAIREMAGRIGHVQIADAPDRHEPGTGEIDFAAVFREVEAAGYDGRIGLEYRPSGPTDDSFGWMEAFGGRRSMREG